jgi:hypothetical protein
VSEQNIVNVVIVCPFCKRDFSVKMDIDDPETEMLMGYAKSTCKGCGLMFPMSENIDYGRITRVADIHE